MTSRKGQRTATCGVPEVAVRPEQARKFYGVAEDVQGEQMGERGQASLRRGCPDSAPAGHQPRRQGVKHHHQAARGTEPRPATNIRDLNLQSAPHGGEIR